MNAKKIRLTSRLFIYRLAPILLCALSCWPTQTLGQVRSGLGYLKLSPGARQVGIAGSLAGTLDYTDSFYANPAATGLLREWQWSASYTNWISDVYDASFLYARQVRTPWSRWTKVAIGLNYLGIPEFDSSDGDSPFVSGNNLLATLSLGQPLTPISNNLSLGANIKYFDSRLADFDASALIFDAGMLYRTPRFEFITPGNGFLDYAIISVGVSITNLGQSVTFETESTPLPTTMRAGVALNMGTHKNLQVSLATDYRKVRDENGYVSIGSEVSWSQLLSVRWGYSFENNLLGSFTFGASLRLDDSFSPIRNTLPGRNNALRFDLAANQNSDFASTPFHGSVTHIPIGPEQFNTLQPADGAIINHDNVEFAWESSFDRDLYDDWNYWLLIDTDSLKLQQVQQIALNGGEDLFIHLAKNGVFSFSQELNQTSFLTDELSSGDYFWSVFAYDSDLHIRFADINGTHIGRFRITAPKLEITNIDFEYSPWITQDDYQGVLKFTLANKGERTAGNFTLSVSDSFSVNLSSLNGTQNNMVTSHQPVPEILPGAKTTLTADWSTGQPGLHWIMADVMQTGRTSTGHRNTESFYTIPKGGVSAEDTVLTQSITQITYELPYVPKVFFDSTSAEVLPRFIRNWVFEPLLVTLTQRLRENPGISISLKGTADPNSGESEIYLANARAMSVRDSLIAMGVNSRQIDLLPGEVLPIRYLPKNSEDARGIMQERRRVEIIVAETIEKDLFRPLKTQFIQRKISPVMFQVELRGAIPFGKSSLQLHAAGLSDSVAFDDMHSANLQRDINWEYTQTGLSEEDWHNTAANYALTVTDSLGRRFKTQPRDVILQTKAIQRERMYFGVAKFALAEPLYNFYWENLIHRIPDLLENKNTRLRFIGHACAIGPEAINQSLSEKRSRLFYDRFLSDVKETYPDLYENIRARIDKPEGMGETQPFTFRNEIGETVLIGNNNLPTGRLLNRRVMALIYSQE